MQLGTPTKRRDPSSGDRCAPEKLGPPCARDAGGRHTDDPVAGEAGPNREIERRVHRGKAWIETAEDLPDGAPYQHSRRRHPEQVALRVVLGLVEFILNQQHGGPEFGDRLAIALDDVRRVGAHEFRPRDCNGWGDLDGAEQARQRIRARRVVGAQ